MRIASFVPGATEIVDALGLTSSLVARSPECDFPPDVRALPVAIRSLLRAPDASPAEIDAQVREALRNGGSLYEVDSALLRDLAPDLLLTQDLCGVCAPTGEAARVAAAALPPGARVLSLNPRTLDDIFGTILDVGAATRTRERAQDVVASLRRRVEQVRRRARGPRKGVAILEWTEPMFGCGLWVPEMVEAAGGREALGRAGVPARTVSWDELRRAAPEAVVIAPCGYHLPRCAELARAWSARPEAAGLGAAVWAVDADSHVIRPGPRVVEGIEVLFEILHGDPAGLAAERI